MASLVAKRAYQWWLWLSGEGLVSPRTWIRVLGFALVFAVLLRLWASVMIGIDFYLLTHNFFIINGYPLDHVANLCIFVPITEELCYRCFPVWVMAKCISAIMEMPFALRYGAETRSLVRMSMIMVAGIVSSVVFGYQHGSFFNIAVQGVFGFAAWNMMIYASRLGKDFRRGMASVIVMHGTYNFFTLFGLFL